MSGGMQKERAVRTERQWRVWQHGVDYDTFISLLYIN